MAELCLFLAKVGQCVSQAFSDMEALIKARKTLRGELRVKREEAKTTAEEIEKLEAKVADTVVVMEERNQLLTEVQDLKAERDRLTVEKKRSNEDLPRLLEESNDACYNEAGEQGY
ncbi:hypothetical protein RHSIM_Rhsim01G0120000 [Rhododendron simsii]|uniref:Uncharacterized protein n=1 Tax=Rhododendron simsii TaxID=118357 RepID=A0A834HHP8_RHOSS|nr:hypothetical protein RHSIM_Rhsim01G0120000 [Rhododendron simsii]